MSQAVLMNKLAGAKQGGREVHEFIEELEDLGSQLIQEQPDAVSVIQQIMLTRLQFGSTEFYAEKLRTVKKDTWAEAVEYASQLAQDEQLLQSAKKAIDIDGKTNLMEFNCIYGFEYPPPAKAVIKWPQLSYVRWRHPLWPRQEYDERTSGNTSSFILFRFVLTYNFETD